MDNFFRLAMSDSEEDTMLKLRCEHANLKEKDTGSFVLKCMTFLSEAVGKKEEALSREEVLELVKLLSITLKVYLEIKLNACNLDRCKYFTDTFTVLISQTTLLLW